MIVTCPKYESDGKTLSPLAGQAVIANLMPEKFSVQAYPGADRIARGEEWIQTNTLDGQHPHDSFIRIGEPSYFQEYGPAGYHVAIGFANPAIINARHNDVCAGAGSPGAVGPCTNTITGQVDVERLSRTPDQRLYPSGSRDAFAWTQCWVSLGDPDGEDFSFTKCDANGNFTFNQVPGGNWRLTIGDQWNDQIIDGLSTPANVGCIPAAGQSTCSGGLSSLNLGNIGAQQWQANLYTRTFVDDNKNGIWDPGEIGIPSLYDDSLPGWAQRQLPGNGLQRRGQLQRDVPAVQLVCRGSGFDPLQDDRHPHRLRRGGPAVRLALLRAFEWGSGTAQLQAL